MSTHESPSVYDRLRERISAQDVLRRLGIEEVRRTGNEVHLRPLCHSSESGESLHLNLDTGRWLCFACASMGVSGDLFQFVEYVLSGGRAPSKGAGAMDRQSHVDAIRWLCEQYVVPFDSQSMRPPAEMEALDHFAGLAHDYLLSGDADEVLDWIQEKWGFSRDVVETFRLGFMPSPLIPELVQLIETSGAIRDAFRACGVGFVHSETRRFVTPFEGRVTFPYLEHGRAVYLIGRLTPWTPARKGRAAKYYKLPVHSEQRPYISKRINNDHLFNDGSLAGVRRVLMTEGVADGCALASVGVQGVVSPVGLSAREDVAESLARRMKESGADHVDIAYDSELSGAGSQASRTSAERMIHHGMSASILSFTPGPLQEAARLEVVEAIGEDRLRKIENAHQASERRKMLDEAIGDNAWLKEQVALSKIDGAEWVAKEGAGAKVAFDRLRLDSVHYPVQLAREIAEEVDLDVLDAQDRLAVFEHPIHLAAMVDSEIKRAAYAKEIADLCGRGVTKANVLAEIGRNRKEIKKERRDAGKKAKEIEQSEPISLLVPPPVTPVDAPEPPPAAEEEDDRPSAPPPPGAIKKASELDHFESLRASVARLVDRKEAEDPIGRAIAQAITRSMGFTAFQAREELFLVRGNERVPARRASQSFQSVLYIVSGLIPSKSAHRGYIDAVLFHLRYGATHVRDVSWSHVADDGSIFFSTGNEGKLVKLEPGKLTETSMSSERVPAVADPDFRPFSYVSEGNGILAALELFRWTSLSYGDRLILIHWVAALPLLRRIGTIPIVRIEGGSSSGKTRTVDGVSWLANGAESSSVPTAAALISRLSVSMLTIDDNRESSDVTPAFQGTLLQATHLGAREKRKANSDTGTVVERVTGALLMNGIEPIHDGKSELASRILTLRCDSSLRTPDSPTSNAAFYRELLKIRDSFWSEALRRCVRALEWDLDFGEVLGDQIQGIFGATRIGRLSAYLRVMYLIWVAGLGEKEQARALREIAPLWVDAFRDVGATVIESLMQEDLVVQSMRYVFASARALAEKPYPSSEEVHAFEGLYMAPQDFSEEYLGPISSAHLARLVRSSAKDLNAPDAITRGLRAGQLEARLLDGIQILSRAGIAVAAEPRGVDGGIVWTFRRVSSRPPAVAEPPNHLGAPPAQEALWGAEEGPRADPTEPDSWVGP